MSEISHGELVESIGVQPAHILELIAVLRRLKLDDGKAVCTLTCALAYFLAQQSPKTRALGREVIEETLDILSNNTKMDAKHAN